MSNKQAWTLEKAREFYNIPAWSEGYFDINAQGHMQACLPNEQKIDLVELQQLLQQQGLSFPVLVRFPQILQARVGQLGDAFNRAMQQQRYTATHTSLYPIKVNQQQTVIENILANGHYPVGLEVGSKTELLAAFAFLIGDQGLLVCNGYKDRAYIRMALHAQRMGLKVFIVIEKLSELEVIRQESEELQVQPLLGIRVRLNSIALGNWQNSGGRNAKFGLNSKDLLQCLAALKEFDWQVHMKMMHFHMGSQISRLEDFSLGLCEAMRLYSEINQCGFNLEYLDIGGGLAIDYAAQQDNSYFSKGYSVDEYAQLVISKIAEYCQHHNISMPNIFTENGRAMTAHHACLMTNAIEFENDQESTYQLEQISKWPSEIKNFAEKILENIGDDSSNMQIELDEFNQLACTLFNSGELHLQQRVEIDQFLECMFTSQMRHVELYDAPEPQQYSKCYCNFSVFQSMPDVWGLDQIFPVMPVEHLQHEPNSAARLHDLTCDSDGQLASYVTHDGEMDVLRLYRPENSKDLVLGFFLLGAYQEVLGDIHNLFGDTHAINVEIDVDNHIILTGIEVGDCAHELLADVHIQGQQVVAQCKDNLQLAKMKAPERKKIMQEIENALYSYTYLDSADRKSHKIKGK